MGVGLVTLVAACAATPASTRDATRSVTPTAAIPAQNHPLTTSTPIEAGTSCGSGYVAAKYGGHTLNLASCAALVGVRPLPQAHVRSGTAVQIVVAEGRPLTITSSDPSTARVSGTTVQALRPGRASIVMRAGAFCTAPLPTEPQPKQCALLTVVVTAP
jgi:hypothetical protein